MLNGERPLVIGTELHKISVTSTSDSRAHILQDSGQDITGAIHDSRLASLLMFRHDTLGQIKGDGTQQGELTVWRQRSSIESIKRGRLPRRRSLPAQIRAPLRDDCNQPRAFPSALSAVEPGPPVVANGKALQLAVLAKPVNASDKLDGLSFNGLRPARVRHRRQAEQCEVQ